MNMIWLHCDGEDDPDIESIGPVTYTPFRGFPGYFYPYRCRDRRWWVGQEVVGWGRVW